MQTVVKLILLVCVFYSCSSKKKQESELRKSENLKVKVMYPDSLELLSGKMLDGDFNGDSKIDFASLVKNKNNHKVGVMILHQSKNQDYFVFGAGKEVNGMTDLNWIEIFELIPKGETVAPELVDEKTGDLLGPDESQNFELIGDGIYMSVTETHGGGIIFWNGKEYQWYHIE